jgi:hypothetical protein
MKLFGGNSKDILKVWELAYRYARRKGKKPGERIDEEFWLVAERLEMKHKFRELKTIEDINQYKMEG